MTLVVEISLMLQFELEEETWLDSPCWLDRAYI